MQYLNNPLVIVKCQTTGDTLYGSNIWDYGKPHTNFLKSDNQEI
jgi:hypothetical protein